MLTEPEREPCPICTESYVRQLLNGHKEPPQWKTIVWDRIVETIGDGDGR